MKTGLAAVAAIAVAAEIIAAGGSGRLKIGSTAIAPGLGDLRGRTAGEVVRILMRVSQLHAGADAAEVEQVMGRPTVAASFDPATGDNRVLTYAHEPVRTRLTINRGQVTDISLELSDIDSARLPTHARMVKPKMLRGGVLALLGKPDRMDHWSAAGLEIEQMFFARADESAFSVFLADGLVADVRPGNEKPSGIGRIVLPAAISHASAGTDLRIGMTPAIAAAALGRQRASATSSFKGQQVLYADYATRDGHGLVSMTFTGGVLTNFTCWPQVATGAGGDTADLDTE